MRLLLPLLLTLTGCGPGLVFNNSQKMTPDEMLSRASHVFVGVIESHHFDNWPFFRVPGVDSSSAKYWMILRRRVRVELIIRGGERRKTVDVYEIFWTGGASGDWNSTRDGERDLFLLRVDNGKYHVVRDWWRSIFTVTIGPHSRLPLDDSRQPWERIALMNYWVDPSPQTRISWPHFRRADPGGALDLWRMAKIYRGLVHHSSRQVRTVACRELISLTGWGQDECWERTPAQDWEDFRGGYTCCTIEDVLRSRQIIQRRRGSLSWERFNSRDERRLLTTVSDATARREFCKLYRREYPGDTDNGCFSDTPPATIVTEKGDIPLISPRF